MSPLSSLAISDWDLSSFEVQVLQQFLLDYLNRFNVFKMRFAMERDGVRVAGLSRNTNTIVVEEEVRDLEPLLRALNVDPDLSIGGDFVIGCDYSLLQYGKGKPFDGMAVSLIDTSNHGYDAFFLAGHLRGILLNVVDVHLRKHRKIQPTLFDELNDMLKGPVTNEMVVHTNPSRAMGTKGAVGIYGQVYPEEHKFRFVAAGMPLFHYSRTQGRFRQLMPAMAPPLGYFASHEAFRKTYDVHRVQMYPGDYVIMATDGCYDLADSTRVRRPSAPVSLFKFRPEVRREDVMCFDPEEGEADFADVEDDGILTFCALLEPMLARGERPDQVAESLIRQVNADGDAFHFDDRSLVVIQLP